MDQHGVVDPVAVAHVPEHAAEVGQQKGTAKEPGPLEGDGGKQGAEQRNQGKPGEGGAPGRQRTGEWERKFQQARRERGSSPQPPSFLEATDDGHVDSPKSYVQGRV